MKISTLLSTFVLLTFSIIFTANASSELPEHFTVSMNQYKKVFLKNTIRHQNQLFVFTDKKCSYSGNMDKKGQINVTKSTCKNKTAKVDYFAFERFYNKNPRFFPAKSGSEYILVERKAIKEVKRPRYSIRKDK